MVNISRIRLFCEGDFTKIENFWDAYNDLTQMYEIHHRKEIDENLSRKQLIEKELYYKRPPEELIFLTKSEHAKIHSSLRKHQKTRSHEERSLSSKKAWQTRKLNGKAIAWNKGASMDKDQRAKISSSRKGKGTGSCPKKKEAMLKARTAYKEYKSNGGTLVWNDWRKAEYKII